MKKSALFILIVLLVTFSGCAADMEEPYDLCEYEPYHPDCMPEPSTKTLEYTSSGLVLVDLEPLDIYNDIVDVDRNFMFVYNDYLGYELTSQEEESLNKLLPKITLLLDAYDINYITSLDLGGFKSLLEANNIEVTTEDIFTFDLFKNAIANVQPTIVVAKTDYLENAIGRNLTASETEGLELLQEHYTRVNSEVVIFDLASDSAEELRIYIELYETLSEENYQMIGEALVIIQEILNEEEEEE